MSAVDQLLEEWERDGTTLFTPPQAARMMRRALWDDNATSGTEHATTQKMPPVRDTVLRRPPAMEVRELRGPELLHALAAELERFEQEDNES